MCSKKLSMLFLVSVLVLVSAMPLVAKWGTPNALETPMQSSETQNVLSEDSQKTLSNLDGKVVVFGSELETIKKDMEDVQVATDLLIQKNAMLEESLKKANGTKLFADVGIAIGFGDDSIKYGITGDVGTRFGKSFMVKTGIQYMLGSFGKVDFGWNLQNLTVNATIGWEW